MFYVVERYLPGFAQPELLRALDRLRRVTDQSSGQAMAVRYLGSTIVPADEACFCHFEAPSEAAIAEVNLRAGLPVDRIVAAVAVGGGANREE